MLQKKSYIIYERLLASIKRSIREELGPNDSEVEAYYRPYADELEKSRPKSIDIDYFLYEAGKSKVTVVGDFHTLDQAQKCFLDVVEKLVKKGLKPVLMLEMVLAKHDSILNRYMKGKLDDNAFLDEINYFKHWGFNFNNYKPLLDFAKANKLLVRGLNKEGSLSSRDRFMAHRIKHVSNLHPDQPVLVLVGDLHLSSDHLPAALKEAGVESITLLQNSESVYMRKLRSGMSPTGWWKLKRGVFLNNNTPPTIKMESYLLWEEHGGEAICNFYGYCKMKETEDPPDLTDAVVTYLKALRDLFALKRNIVYDYEVYTLRSLEFVSDNYFQKDKKGIKLKQLLQEGSSLYVHEKKTLYVPLLDVNHTVEESVHYLMGRSVPIGSSLKAFYLRLHYFSGGYIGSKLLNPNRKTPSLKRMRTSLRKNLKRMRAQDRLKLKNERMAYRGVLRLFELIDKGENFDRQKMKYVLKKDTDTGFAVSRRAGYLLGEGLFILYNSGILSGADLREYVFEQTDPFFMFDIPSGITA